MNIEASIVASVSVAVVGWIYTARRQRLASRRQHTFNALLGVSFNKEYQEHLMSLVPFIRKDKPIPAAEALDDELKEIGALHPESLRVRRGRHPQRRHRRAPAARQ